MGDSNEEDNLDEVEKDELSQARRQSSVTEDLARDAARQGRQKLIQKIAASSFGQKIKAAFMAVKGFMAAHFVPIIVVLVLAIFIVGIVGYTIYMPGLIRGKFNEVVGKLVRVWHGDNYNLSIDAIDEEKRIELLQYLNDMGLDVVGYGFAPGVKFEEDENGKQVITEYTTHLIGGEEYKDNDDGIIDAKGDLLYYYLMAAERAYTRNDEGLEAIVDTITDVLIPPKYLVSQGIEAIFGKEESFKGMLNIKGDEGYDGVEVTIDRDNETLKITKNRDLLNEYEYTFSMADWTGRYGTPIEFTLALHLATMSSGMTRESRSGSALNNPPL